MTIDLLDYESAFEWVDSAGKNAPHLLLGNGFSVAYDQARFSYRALLDHARDNGSLTRLSRKFFDTLDTQDFEMVIRQLIEAATALEVLDKARHADEIKKLQMETENLKNLLAKSLADLHPERPSAVDDEAYLRVKNFINRHGKLYTANYDLLLYWALMNEADTKRFRVTDDGFRSPGDDSEFVIWNHLDPHRQTIYYLHGALHLYRDIHSAQLQKLTWVRTGDALIDQIREQLRSDRFPLIVAEGTSQEKLAKIQTSDYLSKGLRSLAQIGGGMLVYGLSFSDNDAHIYDALVNSKITKIAVSLYGSPGSDANAETVRAVKRLVADRNHPKYQLEIRFYDAATVPLW